MPAAALHGFDDEGVVLIQAVAEATLAHQLLQRYTKPGVTETEVSQRASDEATRALHQAFELDTEPPPGT